MAASVLFVLKGYPRLSETFIAQEILGLERAGLVLRIVALRRPTDTFTHPVHAEIAAPVSYLCEYLHDDIFRVLRAAWHMRRLARLALPKFWADLKRDFSRNRFRRLGQALVLAHELPGDVAHLHAHFIHTPCSVTRYAALMLGKSWSVSAHAKDIWTTPDWELREKLAEADWAVTCTASGCAHLNALAPPDQPVQLVYHGLDLERFAPLTAPRPLRDGTRPDDPVQILTVGRAVEKKGLDLGLEVLARLPPGLHWRWSHIGGGPLLAALKAQAAALGLAARIDWLGAQAQETVLNLYRQSDIFMLPCRIADDGDRDGLPNVLVEAQSQGLACLSTRVSAIPELMIEGETGLLADSGDVAGLAGALQHLIENPELRYRLGQAGARRVRGHFNATQGLARLKALFDASLERAPSHASVTGPNNPECCGFAAQGANLKVRGPGPGHSC